MDLGVKNHHRIYITNLSDDSLHLIFEKLDKKDDRDSFGLTCHRFLDIQNSDRKRLQIGLLPLLSCSVIVDKFLNRFRNLESLSVSSCVQLSDSGLSKLHIYGSSLQSLNLSLCSNVTDTGLALVASGCRSLSVISLYKCSIGDYGLEFLTNFCRSLKQVDLSWCSNITDFGISHLNRNCRQLQALRISGCNRIVGSSFHGFPPTLASFEAEHCAIDTNAITGILSAGGVECLNLSSPITFPFGPELIHIGLGRFASNIKILDFKFCSFVDSPVIIQISKGCPLLQEWNLSACYNIGFPGWKSIGLYCQNLKTLHANRCSRLFDRGLLALGKGCKSLSVIYMVRCVMITEDGVADFKKHRQDVKIFRDKQITHTWLTIT